MRGETIIPLEDNRAGFSWATVPTPDVLPSFNKFFYSLGFLSSCDYFSVGLEEIKKRIRVKLDKLKGD